MDKFQRTKEEMQAESQPIRPAVQNSVTTQLHQGEEEEEEDDDDDKDLQVSVGLHSKSIDTVCTDQCVYVCSTNIIRTHYIRHVGLVM